MATIKHRKFTADRFLDKFKGQEEVLWTYLARWCDNLPDFPEERTLDGFKAYLKDAPQNCEAHEEMIEGLYKAHDLSTKQGYENLWDAITQNQVDIDPDHELHREVLALKLLTEDPPTFQLAVDMWSVSKVVGFVAYKGKEPREIPELTDELISTFESRLRGLFTEYKGERKVLIRHFKDGLAVNFIVYHEVRQKAELVFEGANGAHEVNPLIFRPVRQDFLTYLPSAGKIEIETPVQKDRDSMRRAFGEVCLNDASFFEEQDSEDILDFTPLRKPDFEFDLDGEDKAVLTEIYFRAHQRHGPRFTIASEHAFETLDLNGLRHHLETAEIRAVKIKLTFPENKRGKSIHLSGKNKIAFNRSTRVEEVFGYLKRWGLLRE